MIDAYQQALNTRMHREYAQARTRGVAPSLWNRLRQQPAAVLATLIAMRLMLGPSLLPFLTLGTDRVKQL